MADLRLVQNSISLVRAFVRIPPLRLSVLAVIGGAVGLLKEAPYYAAVQEDVFGEAVIREWKLLAVGCLRTASSVCKDCSPVCRGACISIHPSHT